MSAGDTGSLLQVHFTTNDGIVLEVIESQLWTFWHQQEMVTKRPSPSLPSWKQGKKNKELSGIFGM